MVSPTYHVNILLIKIMDLTREIRMNAFNYHSLSLYCSVGTGEGAVIRVKKTASQCHRSHLSSSKRPVQLWLVGYVTSVLYAWFKLLTRPFHTDMRTNPASLPVFCCFYRGHSFSVTASAAGVFLDLFGGANRLAVQEAQRHWQPVKGVSTGGETTTFSKFGKTWHQTPAWVLLDFGAGLCCFFPHDSLPFLCH